jgi:triosephosphate isomerase
MASRDFFIGGNWKMNGSVEQVKTLVEGLNKINVPAKTGKKSRKKKETREKVLLGVTRVCWG